MENAKRTKKERRFITNVMDALPEIKKDIVARQSLRNLAKTGIPEGRIAQLVFGFCGDDPQKVREGLELAKKGLADLRRVKERLSEDAASVERILETYEKRGRIVWIKDLIPAELPAKMRAFADWLKDESVDRLRFRSGGKEIYKRGKGNRKSRIDVTAGREDYLTYLMYLIARGEVPSKKDYLLVAPLVAAVRRDNDPIYPKIAEALRKRVERFRENNFSTNFIFASDALNEYKGYTSSGENDVAKLEENQTENFEDIMRSSVSVRAAPY